MNMHRSTTHEMLARQTPDDVARAQFIIGFKRHMRAMGKGNETAYSMRAEPRFRARHGRAPQTVEELGSELEHESHYQVWSALTRVAQEMMWDAVETTIEHDTLRMRAAARRLCTPGVAKGSLSL